MKHTDFKIMLPLKAPLKERGVFMLLTPALVEIGTEISSVSQETAPTISPGALANQWIPSYSHVLKWRSTKDEEDIMTTICVQEGSESELRSNNVGWSSIVFRRGSENFYCSPMYTFKSLWSNATVKLFGGLVRCRNRRGSSSMMTWMFAKRLSDENASESNHTRYWLL